MSNMTEYENNYLFFSIIIPAHNEEKYIKNTILSLKCIDYPFEKLEVIIVENGSTDGTKEIIQNHSPEWFRVINISEDGVSKAKNVGIENISDKSDWVIFLDADTFFLKDFLKELNEFLQKNTRKNIGCGMVSILPYPDSKLARGWYHFYNFANHVVKTTRSIQVIRRDLLKKIRFDEELTFDEDTFLLRECQKVSKYFFMKTKKVFSSTRRFEKNGWIRQLFEWIYLASLPYEKKKKVRYKVLR
ncbi:MAG: glycosyltransferase family 2 protein [Brevinematia bacterium]